MSLSLSNCLAPCFKSLYFPPFDPPGNLNKCELYSGSPIAFLTALLHLLNSSKTASCEEYIVEYSCE